MSKLVIIVTLLASLLALFSSLNSNAQEYLMNSSTNGTTITTCSGTLYDSGGAEGNYQSMEEYVVTICSDNSEYRIRISFTAFATEIGMDYLYVYDGTSVDDPVLYGLSGIDVAGQTIVASGTCLTLKFVSDGSVEDIGFAAAISCATDCQDFSIDINSTSPEILTPESYENIFCPGSTVLFSATGTYPNNNQNYIQSDDNLNWNWKVNKINYPSSTVSGIGWNLIEYMFESDGLYSISLEAVDNNGCMAVAPQIFNFNVPLLPDLSEVILEDGVCLGEPVFLTNAISYNEVTYEITPASYEIICMSDEYNQQWQAMGFVVQSATIGQTITSASDLEMICINMEHSYIGDIDIMVECPNGQTSLLMEYPNGCGGTYFGEPIDDDAQPCVPSVGYDYCFSMSGENTIADICEGYGTTIPAGSYYPETSFSNLIGCPVSGQWTVKFMDNLYADDGVVFSASLFFADGIIEGAQTIVQTNSADLSPESTDVFWTGNGIEPNHGTATVTPEEAGEYNYTLTITDSFGCTSENDFTVTVYDLSDPFCGIFCNSMVYETSADTINDGSEDYPSQNNSVCDWLITQPSKSNTDYFCFWNYFDLYEGDVVRIYAGNSDAAPLLLELSGDYEPEAFVIPGTEAYITYTTNGTLRSPGWELVYQTVSTGSPINTLGEVSIYPNPSNGLFNVSGLAEPAKLSVIDMSGRIVMEVNKFENSTLDISNLQNGMYFIKIEGAENLMHKILKQ